MRILKTSQDDPKATALLVKKRNADGFYFRNQKKASEGTLIEKKEFKNNIEELEYRAKINYIYFDDGFVGTYDEELGSYKYLFLLFEPIKKDSALCNTVYFKAWLGDPLFYMKNQIKAGSQGIIVREAVPGYNAVLQLMEGMNNKDVSHQITTDALTYIANQKEWQECDISF